MITPENTLLKCPECGFPNGWIGTTSDVVFLSKCVCERSRDKEFKSPWFGLYMDGVGRLVYINSQLNIVTNVSVSNVSSLATGNQSWELKASTQPFNGEPYRPLQGCQSFYEIVKNGLLKDVLINGVNYQITSVYLDPKVLNNELLGWHLKVVARRS